MKKISSVLYIFLLTATLGCSKNSPDNTLQAATKFAVPTWKQDDTGKYPATMTAVVSLPQSFSVSSMENDKLAAFVNNECRGVAEIIKVNSRDLFFVLIQGLPEEANKITFRYYNNNTAYMYETGPGLTFLADAVYGTAENPETLSLTQLK